LEAFIRAPSQKAFPWLSPAGCYYLKDYNRLKNLLFYYALKNRGFGSERIVAQVSKKKRTATIVI
jgi:hypothetical protein